MVGNTAVGITQRRLIKHQYLGRMTDGFRLTINRYPWPQVLYTMTTAAHFPDVRVIDESKVKLIVITNSGYRLLLEIVISASLLGLISNRAS